MKSWAHLDIAGVMANEGDVPYLGSGMSGEGIVDRHLMLLHHSVAVVLFWGVSCQPCV